MNENNILESYDKEMDIILSGFNQKLLTKKEWVDAFVSSLSKSAEISFYANQRYSTVIETVFDYGGTDRYSFGYLAQYFQIKLDHKLSEEVDVKEYFKLIGKLYNFWFREGYILGGVLFNPFMLELMAYSEEYNKLFDLKTGNSFPSKFPSDLIDAIKNDDPEKVKEFSNKIVISELNPNKVKCSKIFCLYVFPNAEIQKEINIVNKGERLNKLNELMLVPAGFVREGEIGDFNDWDVLRKLDTNVIL